MKMLSKDHRIFSMSQDHAPALTIVSGEMVRVETCDCFSDAIRTEDDLVLHIDFEEVNPATGPIFIEGAMPGDVLQIEILAINLDKQGCMITSPDFGVLGDYVQDTETKIFPITDNTIEMFGLTLPLKKMIGVIGTAPAGSAIGTATPGPHGGNMDCTLITEGATLYLPVEVEGGLLVLGDLHATMGDGEISVSAVEAAGSVDLRIEVLKNQLIPTPSVLTDDVFAVIYSDDTMETASKGASRLLVRYLQAIANLSFSEAYMLVSAIGTLAVCQIIDPLMTMRFEFPREVLEELQQRS